MAAVVEAETAQGGVNAWGCWAVTAVVAELCPCFGTVLHSHPMRPSRFTNESLAVYFQDLYAFDLFAMKCTRLSTDNDTQRPSARYRHGFTASAGRLYVYGGTGTPGDLGERGRRGS